MATSPAAVVPVNAIDVAGLSIATVIPSITDPRAGAIYNPTQLAAAQPIWFHPLHDGTHLMLSARSWSGATPVGGNPGLFSAFTESTAPSWAVINGATGARGAVPGQGPTVPTNTAATSVVLRAAASRAPDFLFLLHAVSIGGNQSALLQHFRVNLTGALTLSAEELLPTPTVTAGTVVFATGLQYDTPWLGLYGVDSTGQVYRMRKLWARVGTNTPSTNPQNHAGVTGGAPGWEFFTGTGYSSDPSSLAPLQSGLVSAGPMSFAKVRNTTVASTVQKSGSTYTGHLWTSSSGRPFINTGAPIALGNTSTYLGGGIQLQPQVAGIDAGAGTAIPYVSSQKVISGANASLVNAWGVLTVS